MHVLPFDRAAMIERLKQETFDLLVIGGGITGVGVALDAASRGLRTALIERDDFASGTSSKSSKLAHGGLRYLQQGEIGLVYEALHERQRLLRNAPHLVRILPFLIPVLSKGGVVDRKVGWALGKAMWMYDLTGGARIGKRHRKLSREDTLAHMPTMPADRLVGGFLYYDATVDDARLCLTVARTAAQHGAAIANAVRATELRRNDAGAIDGVTVSCDGETFTIAATVVVNAAGVWSDEIRTLDEGIDPDAIRPAKGIHLTVAWDKVRNDVAVVIPVPGEKRTLFVVPWMPCSDGTYLYTYIGTTDTDYKGPLTDPEVTQDDIAYVLGALNAAITTSVTQDDVLGVWAGLRPLVKSVASGRTADLSRGHQVTDRGTGVITITGGKLTTYRHMAADTVDHVCRRLDRKVRSSTSTLRLIGAEGFAAPAMGHPLSHLDGRYGTLRDEVDALVAADPTLGQPLAEGLPYVRAEVVYAATAEMAQTLDDVLTRRLRIRIQDARTAGTVARTAADLLAPLLGWSSERTESEITTYEAAVRCDLYSWRTAPVETQ